MSYRDWKVGDKVVCIDNAGQEGNLELGTVYTISAIGLSPLGVPSIALAEKPRETKLTVHWYADRFRPVQVRKSDISVFTALLNPTPHDKHLIEVFDFVSMQGDLQ